MNNVTVRFYIFLNYRWISSYVEKITRASQQASPSVLPPNLWKRKCWMEEPSGCGITYAGLSALDSYYH